MRQHPLKPFNRLIPAVLIVLWLLITFIWLFFALDGEPSAPLAALLAG